MDDCTRRVCFHQLQNGDVQLLNRTLQLSSSFLHDRHESELWSLSRLLYGDIPILELYRPLADRMKAHLPERRICIEYKLDRLGAVRPFLLHRPSCWQTIRRRLL